MPLGDRKRTGQVGDAGLRRVERRVAKQCSHEGSAGAKASFCQRRLSQILSALLSPHCNGGKKKKQRTESTLKKHTLVWFLFCFLCTWTSVIGLSTET